MNKLKTSLILLLTLLVLTAGAFFPKIVSAIQDLSNGHDGSVPITAVELKIVKEVSPVARLIMLSKAVDFTEVSESIASMTRAEALEAVRAELMPYIDAGLIAYREDEIVLTPVLVQTSSMQELQGIVWIVRITGDNDGISNLSIIMDDNTGYILQIEYTHENLITAIPGEDATKMWTDIFFTALDLDYLGAETNAEHVYDDSIYRAKQYSFYDSQYGQVFVNLVLYPYGFSIECVPQ